MTMRATALGILLCRGTKGTTGSVWLHHVATELHRLSLPAGDETL